MSDERVYVPLESVSCDKCGWQAEIEVPLGTDVFSAYILVSTAHRKAEGECAAKWGAQYVRVRQILSRLPD